MLWKGGPRAFRIATPLIRAGLDPLEQPLLIECGRRYPRTVSRSESARRYEPISKSVGLISNRSAHSRALAEKAKEAISRTCPPYISLTMIKLVFMLADVRGRCPP